MSTRTQEKAHGRQRRLAVYIVSFTVFLAAIATITIVTISQKRNTDDDDGDGDNNNKVLLTTSSISPSSSPTPMPSLTSSQLGLAEFLALESIELYNMNDTTTSYSSSLPLLDDPTSPQHQALLWLTQPSDNEATSSEGGGVVVPVQQQEYYGGSIEDGQLSDNEVLQYYAFATFFYATNGDGWYTKDTWMDTMSNLCIWSSITPNILLCLSHGVESFELRQNNNLVGSIPPELALLSNNVQFITIVENPGLTGSIPPVLFKTCTKLQRLYLNDNDLTGTIPTTIGSLTNLVEFDISGNGKLIGSNYLPSEIGKLSILKILKLSNNNVDENVHEAQATSSTIPTEIGQLTSLTIFGK